MRTQMSDVITTLLLFIHLLSNADACRDVQQDGYLKFLFFSLILSLQRETIYYYSDQHINRNKQKEINSNSSTIIIIIYKKETFDESQKVKLSSY